MKYLSKKFKSRKHSKTNREKYIIVNNLPGIAQVWKKYCQKIYRDNYNPLEENTHISRELLMYEEIEEAMRRLKLRKSPSEDEITTEMLKSMRKRRTEIMHKIRNTIWETNT